MIEMRLAYRIASMSPMIPHQSMRKEINEDVAVKMLESERKLIGRSEKIIVDNVAKFFAEHDRVEWSSEEDIPNWAPPLKHFFVEWNEPRIWNMGVSGKIENNNDGQAGVFVIAFPVPEPEKYPEFKEFLSLAASFGFSRKWDSRLKEYNFDMFRWVLMCSWWTTLGAKPVSGRPLWMGDRFFLFVNKYGKLVDKVCVSICNHVDDHADTLWTPINILGLSLSFLHCKNVSSTQHIDDRGDSWHRSKGGVPRFSFRTLNINPMREVLRRDGKSEEVGIKKALHICRGHFANYGPDAPMFGKYTGTFWRPDHVRGASDNGVVVKDYSISSTPNAAIKEAT